MGCFTVSLHPEHLLSVMKRCAYRFHTTIENPSKFYVTSSHTENPQSFVGQFDTYNFIDPSLGNIPTGFHMGLASDFGSYSSKFEPTVILSTKSDKKMKYSFSSQNKNDST